MRMYIVEYVMEKNGSPKTVSVMAHNKEEAYMDAVYYLIYCTENGLPYSAEVVSCNTNNGKVLYFRSGIWSNADKFLKIL